jgi:hypothetical protein
MVERRWRRILGPGVIAMAGLGLAWTLAPTPVGAGPWSPGACLADGPAHGALAAAGPATLDDVASRPWYRLDPVLDGTGTLSGQRLTVGINGARLDRTLILPSEAFAAGPFGGSILVGSDDGRASRLMAIDVARRCTTTVAVSDQVIRSATVDADGTAIYEHRVDRATRADLGVWRRPLDGGPDAPWLTPIGPDPRFGPTWSTLLGWTVDEDGLVVASCAETACRVRVADPAAAGVRTLADPSVGLVVGVAADRVIAHAACRGLPCPLVSVALESGDTTVLAAAGGTAAVLRSTSGPRVVAETLTSVGPRLLDIAPDGSDPRDLGPLGPGLRLGGDPGFGIGAVGLPDGWVLVVPDGGLLGTDDRATTSVRSVLDGRTVPMDEVIR